MTLKFVPVPDGFFQVKTRVHNIIANFISPYDPGDVWIGITDHRFTKEAVVQITIARLPEEPFQTHIAQDMPLREEILKAGHKAAEYFKEKLK